jgi:hypothetical protein
MVAVAVQPHRATARTRQKTKGAPTEVHSVEFKPTAVFFGSYYQACTVVHGK